MSVLGHLQFLVADHGPFYGPTSGWMAMGLMGGLYSKHICHTPWCLRPAHHDAPVEGTTWRLCHKCHAGRTGHSRHHLLAHLGRTPRWFHRK